MTKRAERENGVEVDENFIRVENLENLGQLSWDSKSIIKIQAEMFPGGNGNADLGYNKHAHVHGHGQHGHGHNHNHNQFLAQPPPPPPHFSMPPGGGQAMVTPLVAAGLPLAMQGGAGIDWAQLAQQWIHMRDATPVTMPLAPPPPIISNVREYHQQPVAMPVPSVVRAGFPVLEEHGEADMDMDDENERAHGTETPPPPAPIVTQSQWLAGGELPGHVLDASNGAAVTLGKQPWAGWQTQPDKSGNPTAHIPSLLKLNVSNPNEPQQQLQLQLQAQQQQQQPHATAQPSHSHHNPAPQPHPHPHHHLTPHTHLPPQHAQQSQPESGSSGASTEIDANKRKMLPAWIREGLEKMEREKQRQLERQQSSISAPDDEGDHVKQVSSKTLTTPGNLLNIANVASDSEDSIDVPGEAQQIGNELISKDGDISSSEEQPELEQHDGAIEAGDRACTATVNDVNGKNYEERLADLMLVVRRTLTEILLETTNEEIAAIAGETLKAHRAKASSAQVIRKSALSSITGNLGLAAYGDSSSETEDDEDDDDERQADGAKDADKSAQLSAEELKARIRRSKRSFERVIDDIEDRVAKQELLDEQTLLRQRKRELERSVAGAGEHRRPVANPDPPSESTSQTTQEKLQQSNGKRLSRKERTTRFSDNKDGKGQSQTFVQQVVAAAAVAPLASLSSGSSTSGPQKLKPVPNPATNLLQMPESVATMLSAADKALHKANKSSRKSKSKRRHSSSSSSSSSSGSSSSSDSDDSSSTSSGSKTSGSRSKRASRHGHRSHHGSSRSKYERRDRDKERERERDRDRDRERERERDRDRGHRQHRSQFSGGSSSGSHRQKQRRHRESSHSGEDAGGSSCYHRSSRQSSSRSHDHGSSSSGRKRHRTRSRSKSRSTHHSSSNAYSSTSASHPRKRH
ncbi:arginine/serine-rich protein PNISR isoform X1 [Drosophila santomea]|uniref:arginine/serine-rich protein PNISR isoform X1 n=1 Tax=Drosophila santomea TaxID=129105 RepID=UPI001CCEAABF|nr:arginine/serine-rich protein PNISR isoform X1 [Drosophila santomea]